MFEVWLFDRSGGLVSGQHSLFTATTSQKDRLIMEQASLSLLSSIVTKLSQFDDVSMGYDPTFVFPAVNPSLRPASKEPHTGSRITFDAEGSHPQETFVIERELFCRTSLRGRGTQVWLVKREEDQALFVLKDSWRECGRTSESEAYKKVGHAIHLSIIYRHCTVTIGGQDDTTELCRNGCGTRDTNGQWLETVQRRIHERILFSTHGISLWECESFAEVLHAASGAIQGTQCPFKRYALLIQSLRSPPYIIRRRHHPSRYQRQQYITR
jgi:Fungal protein kinase